MRRQEFLVDGGEPYASTSNESGGTSSHSPIAARASSAAGLVVLGLLYWFISLLIRGGGGQEFGFATYAFLILAAVRFVVVMRSRGRR